jgi:hypothetical protein
MSTPPSPEFPGSPAPAAEWDPSAPTGQTPGKATASLVLGIVGLVICPVVCSVLAVVFGKQAKQEIAANPGMGGAGLAQAGVVLGWVGIALAALGAVFFLAVGLS